MDEVIRLGAASVAALAFAGKAEAKTTAHASPKAAESYLVANQEAGPPQDSIPNTLTPARQKAALEGLKVLQEIVQGTRPNVAQSAVYELEAGTFLAYGPHKGSPGVKVPEGYFRFAELPQLVVVDGRVLLRVRWGDGKVDDQPTDAIATYWVDPSQPTAKVYYPELSDPNKGFHYTIPLNANGPGANLASDVEWFQKPVMPMDFAFVTSNILAKYAQAQRAYFALDPKLGRKPTISDVH